MKVSVTEKEIQTLEKKKEGYSYSIMTRRGKMTVEGIPDVESAIESVNNNLARINRAMLSKNNMK